MVKDDLIVKNMELETLNVALLRKIEELQLQIKLSEEKALIHLSNYEQLNAKLNDERLKKERAEDSTRAEIKSKAELETKVKEWQSIAEQMAHTFNSDIFVAQHALLKIEDSTHRRKAFAHLMEVKELTDLIMWRLKKHYYFNKNENLIKKDVAIMVKDQITTILDSLSILRLSSRQHQKLLSELSPEIEVMGNCTVEVTEQIGAALGAIIKDLLKNSFKNTDQENPKVEFRITERNNDILCEFSNNLAMEDDFKEWFLGRTEIEPDGSTSTKVGLRIVKSWLRLLDISYDVEINKEHNWTTVILTIPIKIRELKDEE